jgi:hypothetical protein
LALERGVFARAECILNIDHEEGGLHES